MAHEFSEFHDELRSVAGDLLAKDRAVDWPVLVDEAVVAAGDVVIGSGIRGSKLIVPAAELAGLATAEVLLIHYVNPLLADVVPFLVLLATLIVRPWGLRGTREELDRV